MVVGDEVDVRQAQAAEPAVIARVHGFPFQLRMGIDPVRAVHAAGAASHHDTVVTPEDIPEAGFVDETVLGGNMTAAENDPMGTLHELFRLLGVPPLQHHDLFRVDAGFADAGAHPFQDGGGEDRIVRRGAHEEHPRARRQFRLHPGEETVVFGKVVFTVAGGASCQKKSHAHLFSGAKLLRFPQKTKDGTVIGFLFPLPVSGNDN